ncbi:MFS transporter [Sphingomonas sp. CLY1604]|uniref:MFS transporter n=1 Tax=Sphingomonas sp. CLY1604 TaxID=3457786 RepID=UPI003FD6C1BA
MRWSKDAAAARDEMVRGWPTLVGATLGVASGAAALPFYTAGVFAVPLREQFGWSLGQVSLAAFAIPMTTVFVAPLAGAVIDRFGVRIPALVGMLAMAGAFAGFGLMQGAFWAYIALIVIMAGLGSPSTPIGYTRFINERFCNARGLALGIAMAGTGFSAALAPPFLTDIIVHHGWRTAYFALSAVVAGLAPIVLILLSIGARCQPVAERPPSAKPQVPAFRTLAADRIVRRLALTFFVLALGIGGFVLHLVPLLREDGMNPAAAALIQARLGMAIIAGRLIIGFLADYVFAPRLAAVSLTASAAGLVALAWFGPVAAPAAAIAVGFALGAEVDLVGYLTARYFGLMAYGRTYGLLYSSFALGTAFSPLMVAYLVNVSGGYTAPLYGGALLILVAVTLLATAPRFPVLAGGEGIASQSSEGAL